MMMAIMKTVLSLSVILFLSHHSINSPVNASAAEDSYDYYKECKTSDIGLAQSAAGTLPNGIPTFLVEIFNTCESSCGISDVHVSCGAFASVKLVNPRVFQRVAVDDCLVNDGQPIRSGQAFSFVYANSFMYPMKVSRADTC
ncbi:TPD1 protein homolog 1-like isoform X2 [Nymphaea colorata]|uniref:TPD1 protein homolog 1-like isoform X2 n=1 Tax=Nymphaea colorata TaxID=210225 RepID=UPI00214E9CA4|nr:TPD1 protein homolog 1-like isoform X2 [Nymphaea colorata]